MEGNSIFSTTISNPLSSLRPQERLCRKSWESNEAYRQRTCDSNLSHVLQTAARVCKDSMYVTQARYPRNSMNCRPIYPWLHTASCPNNQQKTIPSTHTEYTKQYKYQMTNPTSPSSSFPNKPKPSFHSKNHINLPSNFCNSITTNSGAGLYIYLYPKPLPPLLPQ